MKNEFFAYYLSISFLAWSSFFGTAMFCFAKVKTLEQTSFLHFFQLFQFFCVHYTLFLLFFQVIKDDAFCCPCCVKASFSFFKKFMMWGFEKKQTKLARLLFSTFAITTKRVFFGKTKKKTLFKFASTTSF